MNLKSTALASPLHLLWWSHHMTAHGLYISQVQFITVVSKGTFLELRVHFQTGRTHLSVLEAWCTNGQLDSMVHVAYHEGDRQQGLTSHSTHNFYCVLNTQYRII